MIAWLCLLGGLFAATLSLNALAPVRGKLIGLSFAGATFVAELGFLQALACALFAALFWQAGAAGTLPGLLGLGLYAAAFIGAAALEVRALRTLAIASKSLEAIGALMAPSSLGWRARPIALSHAAVERIPNLSYGPAGARNRLDVYRPRGATTPRPVLIQIHGGAWVVGSKNVQGRPLMLHMAASGWVSVAITYRLSPRATWPSHLDDCKLALQWVQEHIAEYGGDPGRIVVTGGSAGGHLAALLALTTPGIAGCAPFYGPYDLATLFAPATRDRIVQWICRSTFGCAVDAREALAKASPISYVHENAPPFLVTHGTADNLVPVDQARRFVAALRAVSKQPVLYCELPGAIHAFDIWRGSRTAATVAAVHRFAEWAVKLPVADQADRAAVG